MHRPFDVAQWRASRTNARHRRVRGAEGQIEKNLTHSMLGVHLFAVGSESATQFSREYGRLFGDPPQREIQRLRLI